MRQVEFHRYWVTPPGRKISYLTDFVMDRETAEREYPGATPEASSRVVCEEPETEEERIEWMSRHHSAGHYVFETPSRRVVAMHRTPAKPGPYRFLDDIGAPPQAVDVVHVDGELVARFQSADADDGADLPVGDLAGRFLPLR